MKTGKIYFVRRADGLVKIGFSSGLRARLAVLSKSHGPLSVLRVINGDVSREKQLHAKFGKAHEFGEWFRPETWVLNAIAELPDGDAVLISLSEQERQRKEGEKRFADAARQKATRLLQTRRARTGATNADCLDGIRADYGISVHFINYLISGRATSVEAYAFHLLGEALVSELTAHRDYLLEEIRLVEAGEPVPAPKNRQRYRREASALAARVAAQKAARK